MPTGILADAVNAVTSVITAKGYAAVTDPRNARPGCVMVELPSSSNFTYNIGNIEIRCRVLAQPPSNSDAANYLLTAADTLMNSALSITDMRPGIASIGGQDLPTYDLTVAVAVRRS